MPDLTVIVPHKSTPANDAALEINLAALYDNSTSGLSFTVVVDSRGKPGPYDIWNARGLEAKSRYILLHATDVIMGPRWDEGFLKHTGNRVILSSRLVEPGSIPVSGLFVERDFGRLPCNFARAAFEEFVEEQIPVTPDVEERAWFNTPIFLHQALFVETGGYDLGRKPPPPLDVEFIARCRRLGVRFLWPNSWAYHFQTLSVLEMGNRGSIEAYRVAKIRETQGVLKDEGICS